MWPPRKSSRRSPNPGKCRDGCPFPLHILQAPRGSSSSRRAPKNDMANWRGRGRAARRCRGLCKQPTIYITNRFSVRGTNTTVNGRVNIGDGLRAGVRITPRTRARTSGLEKQGYIFALHIFKISRARTPSASKWKAPWSRQGQELDGGNVRGPWIRDARTRSVTPYKLKVKPESTARCARRASTEECCFQFEEIIGACQQDETLMPANSSGSGTRRHGCGVELG